MNRNPVQSQQTDKNLRLSRRRGRFALPAMLCGIVILFIIDGGLSLGLHSRGFAVRTSFYISVRCLAYAGLTKALFEMNEKLKVAVWDNSSLSEVTNKMCSIAPENQLLKCLKD